MAVQKGLNSVLNRCLVLLLVTLLVGVATVDPSVASPTSESTEPNSTPSTRCDGSDWPIVQMILRFAGPPLAVALNSSRTLTIHFGIHVEGNDVLPPQVPTCPQIVKVVAIQPESGTRTDVTDQILENQHGWSSSATITRVFNSAGIHELLQTETTLRDRATGVETITRDSGICPVHQPFGPPGYSGQMPPYSGSDYHTGCGNETPQHSLAAVGSEAQSNAQNSYVSASCRRNPTSVLTKRRLSLRISHGTATVAGQINAQRSGTCLGQNVFVQAKAGGKNYRISPAAQTGRVSGHFKVAAKTRQITLTIKAPGSVSKGLTWIARSPGYQLKPIRSG